MKIFQINRDTIDAFKRVWPCHGFPDELDGITFATDDRGDLVDLDAYDEYDKPLDTADFDGPALVAIIDDAQGRP